MQSDPTLFRVSWLVYKSLFPDGIALQKRRFASESGIQIRGRMDPFSRAMAKSARKGKIDGKYKYEEAGESTAYRGRVEVHEQGANRGN